jgi:hypothetical protein
MQQSHYDRPMIKLSTQSTNLARYFRVLLVTRHVLTLSAVLIPRSLKCVPVEASITTVPSATAFHSLSSALFSE